MEAEDDHQRIFSLLRAPLPPIPDHAGDEQAASITSKDNGLLEEVDEAVYENLRFRRHPEAFSAGALCTLPKRSKQGNQQTDINTFDDLPSDPTYCTIPRNAVRKHVTLGRRDSEDTVASSDNEVKREQKAAYRQELRKSSLIHVSDNNSIPVLEGLRQWASYRRISREKSEENLHDNHEKVYDTPNHNLNPYLTHRRAPKTSPKLPEQWKHSNQRPQTLVSPLESFDWDVVEGSEQHAPPKKPPPRPVIKKKNKPILKSPISILKNDLKSDNVPNSGDGSNWIKKRIERLKGADGKDEKFEYDTTDGCAGAADRKEKTPFFYCKLITAYPKTAFVLTLGGHLLIMIITVVLLLTKYDLFPTDFENLPMYDWNVPWRRRDMAWQFRDEYDDKYVRKLYLQGLPKWYRALEYHRGNIMLFYDTGNNNVFTKQNFERMEYIEKAIMALPEYVKYCVQDASGNCKKPTSVLRYFDGTYSGLNPVFYDPNYNRIPAVLYTALKDNRTKGKFAILLAKDHSITPQHAHATLTRTVIPLGYPLRDVKENKQMEAEMQKFLKNSFKPLILKLKSETKQFDLVYWSYLLFMLDIAAQASKEMLLTVGSLIFIFSFMVFHTKSLWISSFAVLSIGSSFLAANMIYRIVLDFRYFGLFHIIAMFIILGIGADDLFVFLDVWKNTAFNSYPSLAHRLSDAYKRSSISMFITSLTTVIAFFASSFSPLLPAKTFGVFAGLLVIVNYISVIIFFPTVVIMYHIYFAQFKWPCLSCCPVRKRQSEDQNTPSDNTVSNGTRSPCEASLSCTAQSGSTDGLDGHTNKAFVLDKDMEYGFIPADQDDGPLTYTFIDDVKRADIESMNNHNIVTRDAVTYAEICVDLKAKPKEHEKKRLVRFFRDYFYRLVTQRIAKWIIMVALLLIVAGLSYSAATLEPDNEQVKYYRGGHNYGKALNFDSNSFVSSDSDREVAVYVVWGLHPRDMSICHFSDQFCTGKQTYDHSFDPNSPQAQKALMNFCDTLLNMSPDEIEKFKIRRNILTGQPEIRCFMKELRDYLWKESLTTGVDWSLPWDYTKTMTFMWNKPQFYDTRKFNQTFRNLLQIPISYWLNNGYRFWNVTDFRAYHPLIGEEVSPYSTPLKTEFSVLYGNKIKYIGVQVNLTLGRFSTGYKTGKPVMDRWENFISAQMQQMPPGLQKGFQLTRSLWHTLSVQKTMADSAIFGIVLGILCALPILILATRNIIIGFFATFSMCCTTVCVIGVIPLAGWKLGLLESLNMCMVVGLSVDYVVHLAEGYHMSAHADRMLRLRDMLEEVGISVFSGACTTLGASLFMLFAQIQFLVKFGIFMFCTIGFSLIFSLGFFSTIMGILGPSGRTGDIRVLFHKLCNIRKKKTLNQSIKDTPDRQSSIEEDATDRV